MGMSESEVFGSRLCVGGGGWKRVPFHPVSEDAGTEMWKTHLYKQYHKWFQILCLLTWPLSSYLSTCAKTGNTPHGTYA